MKSLENNLDICNNCNGNGVADKNIIFETTCSQCGGFGKVIWIDNIIPKSNPCREIKIENIILLVGRVSHLVKVIQEECVKSGIETSVILDFHHRATTTHRFGFEPSYYLIPEKKDKEKI